MSLADTARKLLQEVRFMVLATATTDGQPWSSPLAYSFDDHLALYWRSGRDAQHSKNIAVNGNVFISIFDSATSEPGLFLQAEARALDTLAEIERALSCDRHPEYADLAAAYLDPRYPRRYYVAVPVKAWVNISGTENGKFVDIRKEIELKALKERL